jgi:D-alanyl-D-alanine carboxypeptidase
LGFSLLLRYFLSGLAASALIVTTMAAPAFAARQRHHTAASAAKSVGHNRRAPVRMLASPTDPAKDAALVVDGATGKVLYARNEAVERHPASLTKMMTLYLLFDALKAGKLNMQTQLPVSYHASIQKPTKLSLRPGQSIDVDTAIRAIVIRSANDVAVVVAEALGGTESHFSEMMTERARQIGMRESNFHNASGLPDPLQITTALDLAKLARHLAYDYPQYFPYFALSGFNYKGAWYPTHDNLIGRYSGADGIKTGYTGASGFNLVSSVTRGTTHLVAVVMGGRTAVRRDQEMMRLLDQTFAQVTTNPTLVAARNVPWQRVASAPVPAQPSYNLPQVASATPSPSTLQSEDEDAAEQMRAPDEAFPSLRPESGAPLIAHSQSGAFIGSPAPPPQPVPPALPSTQPQPPLPLKALPAVPPLVAAATPASRGAPSTPPALRIVQAPHPTPRPDIAEAPVAPQIAQAARPDGTLAKAQAQLVNMAVNTPTPAVNAPRPQMRPSLREDVAEGDSDPTPSPGRNWTIQIGAYADKALAAAQLKTYYGKAQDVLARASQIIAPITSPQGHVLYRARFGLFAEQEARAVCNRLTQRGQTCFAAVQTR